MSKGSMSTNTCPHSLKQNNGLKSLITMETMITTMPNKIDHSTPHHTLQLLLHTLPTTLTTNPTQLNIPPPNSVRASHDLNDTRLNITPKRTRKTNGHKTQNPSHTEWTKMEPNYLTYVTYP